MTEHVLDALRIPVRCGSTDPAHMVATRIAQAQTLAYSSRTPVALLLDARPDVGGAS